MGMKTDDLLAALGLAAAVLAEHDRGHLAQIVAVAQTFAAVHGHEPAQPDAIVVIVEPVADALSRSSDAN